MSKSLRFAGRWWVGLVVFFAMNGPTATLADEPPLSLVEARECSPRHGLPNFLAKVRTPGDVVKVAFLGGSITGQDGWRPQTLALLKETFESAKFFEINAAIGGTGSDLGVYRLKHDVLDFKPDLLFIEFVTNDGEAPPLQIQKCMEGIVRQTWKSLPNCDICFVYTIIESHSPALIEGKLPRAASAMERVAEVYGIPTIEMGMQVARLAKQGKLVWSAPLPATAEEKKALGDKFIFAPDGVHPYRETGHVLYLAAIARSLKTIIEASKSPGPHTLGDPLVASNYENAKLIPIEEASLSQGFAPAPDESAKRFADRLPTIRRGSTPGETIQFKFKGTAAAIYDVIGPNSGSVTVTLDDGPPRLVTRFDAFCLDYRLAVLPIGIDLPDAVHTVKIEIDAQEPDRSKILAQRGEKPVPLERFRGTAFYPGAILLVGELLK